MTENDVAHEKASPDRRLATLDELLGVMERLRGPGGCAWDRKQTFATIAPYTIEEAYEVADAIEREEVDDLRDELGDLLFQVVFHAQMAAEQGAFDFSDVAGAISAKMVRRHPHVFVRDAEQGRGGATLNTDDTTLNVQWEQIKSAEREARQAVRGGPQAGSKSLMDDIPRGLAALKRAEKVQRRAARVGFDWTSTEDVVDKVREELDELEQAVREAASNGEPASSGTESGLSTESVGAVHEHIFEELGDLLFSVTNLARHLGLDADRALSAGTAKFERRFKLMEAAAAQGTSSSQTLSPLDGLSAEELEALWAGAKAATRKGAPQSER